MERMSSGAIVMRVDGVGMMGGCRKEGAGPVEAATPPLKVNF
jgi:hypothetical protein